MATYTKDQVENARRIVEQADKEEREAIAAKTREANELIARLTQEVKDKLRELQSEAQARGVHLNLRDIVEDINDIDSYTVYHSEDWYSSSC